MTSGTAAGCSPHEAERLAAGVSIEKDIGIDLSAQTGYSNTAQLNFKVNGSSVNAQLCGRNPAFAWDERQPAKGASIPRATGQNVENIVLAVARAPGQREAWAGGILVKYNSGGQGYTLLTATRIAIVTQVSQCNSLLNRIDRA